MDEPRAIKDGEPLPMIGGPLDGERYRVEFALPFLNGGIAPGAVSFGPRESRYFYVLDHERRAWVYQPNPHPRRRGHG